MSKKILTNSDCQCHSCQRNESFVACHCKILWCNPVGCGDCTQIMAKCTAYANSKEEINNARFVS